MDPKPSLKEADKIVYERAIHINNVLLKFCGIEYMPQNDLNGFLLGKHHPKHEARAPRGDPEVFAGGCFPLLLSLFKERSKHELQSDHESRL